MVQARGRTFLVVAALALSSHIWPVGSERGSEETGKEDVWSSFREEFLENTLTENQYGRVFICPIRRQMAGGRRPEEPVCSVTKTDGPVDATPVMHVFWKGRAILAAVWEWVLGGRQPPDGRSSSNFSPLLITEAAKPPVPSASARDAGRWRGKERGAVRSVFPRSADGRNNGGLLELDHGYYKSQYSPSYPILKGSWESVGGGDRRNVVTSGTLDSGKRTKAVRLSFAFPFYGHPVRNLSIATEGFLSTGSLLLSSLASTQYIAPLMANFGAGKDPPSVVRYRDNGTSFTVEWSKVKLQDSGEGGRFSFMVTLFKDGRIAYFYKEIPTPVERIDDSSYPVRVGISDAYTVDVLLYPSANGHRKTIYEYNTIDLDLSKVKNGSSFFLSPLPTCTQFPDCQSCVSARIGFECRWCRSLRRCSDGGKDRNKQQWVDARCDEQRPSMDFTLYQGGTYGLSEEISRQIELLGDSSTSRSSLSECGDVGVWRPLAQSFQRKMSVKGRPLPIDRCYRDTMTRPDSGQLPPQETTPKSSSRQKTVHNFLDDGPFPVEVEVNGNAKENKNKRKRTSVKTRPRYLETEVIIGILIAVVVLVIAIAWIIHAYSRRSSPELVVVEILKGCSLEQYTGSGSRFCTFRQGFRFPSPYVH
uniref:PSI domain-containing protein n=1 Tax=Branchiostoma floridae TaxID=7739 RepID=C3ZAX9_BRAFL|eukprot:XP_002594005.1 hypothetical protein BRAFLDRAFT_68556 [Branchiostoma floridae]